VIALTTKGLWNNEDSGPVNLLELLFGLYVLYTYTPHLYLGPEAENEGQREDHFKQRDPQSRKPYSIWWQCEYAAPQSPAPLDAGRRDRRPEQGEVRVKS